MSGDLIRVLLVDDHAVVRAGLRVLLTKERDLDVVGEASNGADAIALAERLKPDVILMDVSMEPTNGLEATGAIVAKGLPSRVIVLTMHDEEDVARSIVAAGASGYALKTATDRELLDAVRSVARGHPDARFDPAKALANRVHPPDPRAEDHARFEKLTPRERDVVRLVAQGYSAPEIGDRLRISAKTVDTYKQRVQDKLGLEHRHDYVQFALRLDLLKEK